MNTRKELIIVIFQINETCGESFYQCAFQVFVLLYLGLPVDNLSIPIVNYETPIPNSFMSCFSILVSCVSIWYAFSGYNLFLLYGKEAPLPDVLKLAVFSLPFQMASFVLPLLIVCIIMEQMQRFKYVQTYFEVNSTLSDANFTIFNDTKNILEMGFEDHDTMIIAVTYILFAILPPGLILFSYKFISLFGKKYESILKQKSNYRFDAIMFVNVLIVVFMKFKQRYTFKELQVVFLLCSLLTFIQVPCVAFLVRRCNQYYSYIRKTNFKTIWNVVLIKYYSILASV